MNDLEFVGDYRQPQLSARQRALGHDGSRADDFTFGDLLDIINPLQHIPVVSSLYREITGDEISPHARILGDTLYGGPAGFLSSVANVFYEEVAGEDIGETVLAFFSGEAGEDPAPQFAGDDGTLSPAGTLPTADPAPLDTAAGDAAHQPVEAQGIGPGVLTGQDALNALFMDLRGGRQNNAALPLAEPNAESLPLSGRAAEAAAMKSYPLPPRHIRVQGPGARAADTAAPDTPAPETAAAGTPGAAPAVESAAHPLLFAQEAGDGALADRMMQALDKYRAMARQGAGGRREDDEPRPVGAVRWQADPAAAP